MKMITKFVADDGLETIIFISLFGIISYLFLGGPLGNIITNISNNILG